MKIYTSNTLAYAFCIKPKILLNQAQTEESSAMICKPLSHFPFDNNRLPGYVFTFFKFKSFLLEQSYLLEHRSNDFHIKCIPK